MAQEHKDTERELFGNGILTVAARLSSVIMPFLMGLVLWLGNEVWGDIKVLKNDKVEMARAMASILAKQDEHSRWNALQDLRIDRLVEGRVNNGTRQQ